MQSQRGSGTLLMVMIMLLMGTLLLHATRRQLSDNLNLVADERRYIQQFSLAMSALTWGERLHWSVAAGWHCQRQQTWLWRACTQRVKQGILLRADSGNATLALYRWVSEPVGGRVQALPHGWLDYCPLAKERDCEPDPH